MVEEYDKLVRDRIPEVIEANGERPDTHVADDREYGERLHAKLDEEVAEFHDDPGAAELADVLEVVAALREYYGVEADEIEEIRREKAAERGRFAEGIVLDAVER